MRFIALGGLGLALGYAALQKAGVSVQDWDVCLIAIGLTCAGYFLIARRVEAPRLDGFARAMMAGFLGIAALQLAPLPVAAIRVLSPGRAELLDAVSQATGMRPGFATLSATPYESAGYFLTLCGYLAVLLLVRDLAFHLKATPWAVVWPLLVVGALEAVLGYFQISSDANERAKGTYVNPDHFAGLLEMILPFAVMYPLAILHRSRKAHESPTVPALQACGVLAIAAVLLVGIIYSLSRMGFLVALASLFVVGAITLSLRGWVVDSHVPVPLWRRSLPLLLVAILLVVGFVFLPTDPLIARFADFAKTDDISADTRAQLWRDTTELIRSYPWFGCGLGGYESCFYRFKTVAPMSTADYAHNDYLQVLAEMGVVGFLCGALLVGRLVQRSVHGALYATTIDDRYLAIACTASMTGMLLHSFVDFNMYVPANGLVFAWIAGIAGVHLRQRKAGAGLKRGSGNRRRFPDAVAAG